MAGQYTVVTTPDDSLSFTNRAIFHPDDLEWDEDNASYIEFRTSAGESFIVAAHPSTDVGRSQIALNFYQRQWTKAAVGQTVDVEPYTFNGDSVFIDRLEVRVEHATKMSRAKPTELDTDKMSAELSSTWAQLPLTVGQPLLFKSTDVEKVMKVTVLSMTPADTSALTSDSERAGRDAPADAVKRAILMANSNVVFRASDDIRMSGAHVAGDSVKSSFMSTDLDFVKMGIGGLDKEATILFRRAFASRVFPPRVIQKLGVRHVKGILLYGPPGCGKTLMARQIGNMLNARKPKIVNGPEILNKYVGESEANIRKLFQEAEEEQKRAGPNSGLHMIIFDEIDAICKRRGSGSDNTGVHDNVVTQLLSKMDGVDELDNILIVGMTNRKDLIDDALMRPGRFEIQLEIGLPNEFGRKQILQIHTTKISANGMLDCDVDLAALAHKTINFSGAELAGLVRAATATAMNRIIKNSSGDDKSSVTVKEDEADSMKVTQADFLYALANDIKPMFGVSNDQLSHFKQYGMVDWGASFSETSGYCKLMIDQMLSADGEDSIDNFTSLLLYGEEGTGTSALAVKLALESGFTFIKVCSTLFMNGTTESAKVNAIHEVFEDAYRAHQSCVIVDCIENLIEFTSIGRRYSSHLLQEVRTRVAHPPPKGHKLLVIGTTSNPKLINKLKVRFRVRRELKPLTEPGHVEAVLSELNLLKANEIREVCQQAAGRPFSIGVKHLISIAGEARVKPTAGERISSLVELFYAPREDEDDCDDF